MRNGLPALLVVLIGAVPGWTQPDKKTPPPPAKLAFQESNPAERPVIEPAPAANLSSRIWGRSEYLLWWVKNPPLPVPLVTTGDPATGFPLLNTAGAIDQPSTRVLLGGSNAPMGAFSGLRTTIGGWIGREQIIGIEGSGFLLEQRTDRFSRGSDGAGNPPLYFPAFNVQTQGERALAISDPLRGFAGDVFVNSTLQLWGAEFNGLLNVRRDRNMSLSLLGGFRYIDLKENLEIHNSTTDLIVLNTTTANDHFDSRNQFYGGQLGGRFGWQRDRLSLDVTAKVALGVTHEVVNIQGDITNVGPGPVPNGTFPGGIYAQPSNMGRRSANRFSVVPSVELKVAYDVTPRVRVFAGYDFLYWNQVVRPGNQIDRNVNQSQSPIFGGGALVGPAAPAPFFNRSDFWVHGANVGVEFRY